MTYEQKAKEIAEKMVDFIDIYYGELDVGWSEIQSLITTALREAGNAKLEEAAAMLDDSASRVVSAELFEGQAAYSASLLKSVSSLIRSLIEKD